MDPGESYDFFMTMSVLLWPCHTGSTYIDGIQFFVRYTSYVFSLYFRLYAAGIQESSLVLVTDVLLANMGRMLNEYISDVRSTFGLCSLLIWWVTDWTVRIRCMFVHDRCTRSKFFANTFMWGPNLQLDWRFRNQINTFCIRQCMLTQPSMYNRAMYDALLRPHMFRTDVGIWNLPQSNTSRTKHVRVSSHKWPLLKHVTLPVAMLVHVNWFCTHQPCRDKKIIRDKHIILFKFSMIDATHKYSGNIGVSWYRILV